MRTLLMLSLLALIPAASAAAVEGPQLIYYDYDVQTGPTYGASVDAGTYPAPNCADCDAIGTHASAETDGASYVNAQFALCRSGFFYFCVIDEDKTVTVS